ncbi:MAG: DUF1318 domain-containing protein [Verrucomicrobiae bacterium]
MRILSTATALAALAGCSAPNVNLSTAEPIKVDIAMRLDVYDHNKESAKKPPSADKPPDPEAGRRNRMADIQNFKNSRLVGEGRDGQLSIRVDTPGDPGDYLRKTVAAENEDRMALMTARTVKEKRNLADIQAEQAALWRQRSFEGELIEISNPDGTFVWIAKSGR